ncbi:sensor histidine kinase [Eubacterium sp.]
MINLRQKINSLSVKKKLVFYGYLTITPVLVVVCIVLLFSNYNKVLNQRLENDLSSVNALADSINVLQGDIKDFSTYICINNDVRKLLSVNRQSEKEQKNQNAKLWLEEAPMQIVQDMMAIKGHCDTIAIYPENGIRPYLRCMDGSSYIYQMDIIRDTDIYKETIESDNGMVWKSVSKGSGDTYITNRSDKIVLYREIFDMARKKTLGYIVIGASQEQFKDLCENVVKDGEGVIILDKNGGELSRVGKIDEDVETYLKSDIFMKKSYKDRENHFSYGNFDVVCNQISENASIVCKIVPRYRLQMQVFDVAYMPIMLLLGMLVGLMPLLLIISNVVTKPLSKVSEAIRKFSTGDFEQRVEVTTNDEVGEVAKCFNRMVGDIKKLIDENYVITLKEKESELTALQSQINPHFLYNTLDSLYWQATEAGNDEIAESILALSQLFKLVLSRGSKEVTVGHEIELITRYLQIQKMRFTKRLNYSVEVDESIIKAKIPKLIIQPFVENAIVHGFENVSVPCNLKVTGKREGSNIRFEIKDTGIGMRQDQIDAIWEEESAQYSKQRIGRYAIKNIRERLELKYDGKFTLDIQSAVGKGTTVILIIPFEEEEA